MVARAPTRDGRRLGGILALAGLAAAVLAVVRGVLWWWRTTPQSYDLPRVWADAALLAGGLMLALAGLVLHGRWLARARHTPATFLTPAEEARVLEAIKKFEGRTSGEIRVHLAGAASEDVLGDARQVFERLGMTATRERNGVLFFVAAAERRFAVLGDAAIHERVPDDFWSSIAREVEGHFRRGQYADALIHGIERAGEALATFFPHRPDDVNELPDDISRS